MATDLTLNAWSGGNDRRTWFGLERAVSRCDQSQVLADRGRMSCGGGSSLLPWRNKSRKGTCNGDGGEMIGRIDSRAYLSAFRI